MILNLLLNNIFSSRKDSLQDMLKKWLVKPVFDMHIKFWACFLFFLHFCFANEFEDSLAIDAYVLTTIEIIKSSNQSPFSSCKNYSIYSMFEYKKQELSPLSCKAFEDKDFKEIKISQKTINHYNVSNKVNDNCPIIKKMVFNKDFSKGVIWDKELFDGASYIEKNKDGLWHITGNACWF